MTIQLSDYFEEIKGRIIKEDFPNCDISLEEQIDYLHEDLTQIVFSDSLVLDLGYYNLVDLKKYVFKIYIILNMDWDIPVKVYETEHLSELLIMMEEALSYVHKRLNLEPPKRITQ